MLALTVAPSWLPRVAYARSTTPRDVLITVFLRGGADGLSLVPPHGEPNYYALRPTQAVPQPTSGHAKRAKDLDGFFGLSAPMSPLFQAYEDDNLAIIHAVGGESWTRSHFDAMRWMETSSREVTASSGWVGRHLNTMPPPNPDVKLRGVSLTDGTARLMTGGDRTLPIPDPDEFGFHWLLNQYPELVESLKASYSAQESELKAVMRDTSETIDLLNAINFSTYQSSGTALYADDDLGKTMRATAALIKAGIGIEAIHIDVGGWDTHEGQGTLDGDLDRRMTTLGTNLAALYDDLSSAGRTDWTLVMMSEFGRTAAENNTAGTDHGTGGVMLAMGAQVNGGRVLGSWPGLADGELFDDQDLAVTSDYRNVLAEIAAKRLSNPQTNVLFPGLNYQPMGVIL